MNVVNLVGNLTKDPELQTTQNGTEYCNFILAVQRNFKNAQGEYEADFILCKAWRRTAEFVQKYFAKGSKMALTGSIRTGSYQKDGETRYTTEVVADNVEFAGSRKDRQNTHAASAAQPQKKYGNDPAFGEESIDEDFQPLDDSELPF